MRRANTARNWLLATVLVHLAATVVHGRSHAAAHVGTTFLQNVFIIGVIIIGPLVGSALAMRRDALGGWAVALTMGGALVFGVVNHFLLPGGDRIDHVRGPWAITFAASAAILAITEAIGVVVGVWYAASLVEKPS